MVKPDTFSVSGRCLSVCVFNRSLDGAAGGHLPAADDVIYSVIRRTSPRKQCARTKTPTRSTEWSVCGRWSATIHISDGTNVVGADGKPGSRHSPWSSPLGQVRIGMKVTVRNRVNKLRTVQLTRWPSYTNMSRIPWRYTGCAQTNVLRQGFRKLSY